MPMFGGTPKQCPEDGCCNTISIYMERCMGCSNRIAKEKADEQREVEASFQRDLDHLDRLLAAYAAFEAIYGPESG